MAEATQNEKLETISIGDKVYDAQSLTEMGANLINDIKKVEAQIGNYSLQLSIANLAKAKLAEELQKEIPNFKEVEQAKEG